MTTSSLLIGDIGGTHARFALAASDTPAFASELKLSCGDFGSAHAAIDHYLQEVDAVAPSVICLAAAGPVVDQNVRFTNNHWSLSAQELRADYPNASVHLLNDFEAVAYSIPFLDSDDSIVIGLPEAGDLPNDNFSVGVIGPGTGLGAVGLRMTSGAIVPIVGEAGHIGFAPVTQVQLELLTALRERFDRVSSERLVSGPGLENIHWALGRVHGQDWPQRSASEIFAAADSNSDGRAAEAVQMFFEVLGQVAGDFALAIGGSDGMFIGGGIVPRHPDLFANSSFRSGFENKGRYRSLMEAIPTRLIMHKHAGLLGAAYFALQMSRG